MFGSTRKPFNFALYWLWNIVLLFAQYGQLAIECCIDYVLLLANPWINVTLITLPIGFWIIVENKLCDC